jgi:hypothetical protein
MHLKRETRPRGGANRDPKSIAVAANGFEDKAAHHFLQAARLTSRFAIAPHLANTIAQLAFETLEARS